jgi:hypothetical protein
MFENQMTPYKDIGNDSGVSHYRIETDGITVRFKTGGVYQYNNASTGSSNINAMIQRAKRGDGLGGFINTHVRDKYSKKIC